MASAVPGAEFYRERLARAPALPEAQRSPDVRTWLASHAALEAAAAVLPPMRPGQALEEPAGGRPALAALLRFLAHSFCHPAMDPLHPSGTLRFLGPQLPPLMRVWAAGIETRTEGTLLLSDIVSLPPGEATELELTVELTTRLLLLALVSCWPSIGQLAQLQEEVGDEAAGAEHALPTVDQLQVVWHVLQLELVGHVNAPSQLAKGRISAAAEEAARGLLRLQPRNPRSSFAMGKVAVMNHSINPGSQLQDPLPHLLRCAELAREQRSDFWLAR
ncbi:hypothetical protein ABPG75_007549 [Micractinium tetrahymenae]